MDDRFFVCKYCGEKYLHYVCGECSKDESRVWTYYDTCQDCHNELAHGIIPNVTYRETWGYAHCARLDGELSDDRA